MSRHLEVPPVDERVTAILGGYPPGLFSDDFYRSWELIDRYGRAWIVDLASELTIDEALESPRTLDELRVELAFVEAFDPALAWIVRSLTEVGWVSATDSDNRTTYQRTSDLPDSHRTEIRDACLAEDEANRPTLDLLDAAAKAYPPVARGEIRGQEALFGLGQTQLWLDYFHNGNPTYAVNNRLAAHVAVRGLPPGRIRILELGAGAGSGTEALLEALEDADRLEDLGEIHFSEPSPFFRRRAERHLRSVRPDLPWRFSAVDLDQPLDGQGIEDDTYDLIYAVNVIHVARDLDRSLRAIRRALAPGGRLVAAESIRPFAGRTISTELVFQILEDFWDVDLDPERRPTPGFLTPEQWTSLFTDNGFDDVRTDPDHVRIREIYPRFCTGVISGSRTP